MQQFADNIAKAKKISKEWDKKHKASLQKYLKEIEEKRGNMYLKNGEGVFSREEIEKLKTLEKKRIDCWKVKKNF